MVSAEDLEGEKTIESNAKNIDRCISANVFWGGQRASICARHNA
jgi:hypothetical protein